MTDKPMLPSDRQLVDAARVDHEAAWQELLKRHESSVTSVITGRRRGNNRSVAAAFETLRGDLANAGEGVEAVRSFRPRAIAAVTGGSYGPGAAEVELAPNGDEVLLARAFARLPEPWQTVLWHVYVEQLTSAEVSPLVGRSTNDIPDLITTAERGLVDAFAIEVLHASDLDDETAAIVPLLSGYVRDALPPNDHRRVSQYLESNTPGTERSRAIMLLATSLADALPPAVAPGITGLTVHEHRKRLGTIDRAFGAATLLANRSDRVRRAVLVGVAAAVVLTLIGVGLLVRQPFVNDDDVVAPETTGEPVPTTDADALGGDTPDDGEPDGDAPDDGSDSDPTVPSTTELDLRPQPTGPSNTIEINIDDGNRAIGLVAADAVLTAEVSTAGPAFAGGSATIDLALTNAGADVVEAAVELVLPRGVRFDALVSGDAECVDPDGDSPFCNVSVEAGATLELAIRIRLESSVVGRLAIEGDSLGQSFEAPIVATRDLIHNSVGRGDVVVVGNTVMVCDADAVEELGVSCDDVHAGAGEIVNRWDVPMTFTNSDSSNGLGNGSSAVLDVSADATVLNAFLFWSGDLEERGATADPDTESNATLIAPDGTATTVEASEVRFGEEDATQYVSRVDVTELVATGGAGSYTVGDIASVETQGSYGAWALVVIVNDDSFPLRHRIVTDPFDWVAPEDPFDYRVELPSPIVTGATGQLDVVAFEGERGFEPEQFVIDGETLGGANPFDSSIVGERNPSLNNNLGVDIDAYDLVIDTPDGTLGIDATSMKDGIRLAVLALTVDLVQ
ncbi:MAG: RNA polymerase sigma factor [Ilumatobacter sp.]